MEFRRLKAVTEGRGRGGAAAGGMGPLAKALAKKKAALGRAPATNSPRAKSARPQLVADPSITPEQAKFFENKIRPVLMTTCAKCHASTSEKVKGGLLVDSREGLRKGGDTGPAVVPGNLEESLLITAIRYDDESLQMPPKCQTISTKSSPISEKWGKDGGALDPAW